MSDQLPPAPPQPPAPRLTVRPATRDDIDYHVPADTVDEAYIQIGTVRVQFDASGGDSRTAAIAALEKLQRAARQVENHLRVIKVRPLDFHADMKARWTPSAGQDRQAADWLRDRPEADRVYTAQLLAGTTHGFWTHTTDVIAVDGIYPDRNAAADAAQEYAEAYRLLQPGTPLSISYCSHHRRGPEEETTPGRTWRTSWAMFEDYLDSPAAERTDEH